MKSNVGDRLKGALSCSGVQCGSATACQYHRANGSHVRNACKRGLRRTPLRSGTYLSISGSWKQWRFTEAESDLSALSQRQRQPEQLRRTPDKEQIRFSFAGDHGVSTLGSDSNGDGRCGEIR